MTDTPNTILTSYITWIKAHERLLIVLIGAFLVFHFYGDVLNAWSEHDKRQIAAQQAIALSAQQKTALDTQANTQLSQQLSDLRSQYSGLSKQIQLASAKRTQDVISQEKQNDASTSAQIAARTATIIRVEPQEITANSSDGTITFTSAAAHVNINQLEDGIKAEADVLDLNKQIGACTALSAKQDDAIAGINKQLSDEKLSHQADVKLEQANTQLAKVEGKRQFRKGLKIGAIVGFIGGLVTFHYL
jgi:hypothetical protein